MKARSRSRCFKPPDINRSSTVASRTIEQIIKPHRYGRIGRISLLFAEGEKLVSTTPITTSILPPPLDLVQTGIFESKMDARFVSFLSPTQPSQLTFSVSQHRV